MIKDDLECLIGNTPITKLKSVMTPPKLHTYAAN